MNAEIVSVGTELLLGNIIVMPYEEAHDEACRWEHVMSDAVEKKVYELLNKPSRSPYGTLCGTRATGSTRPSKPGRCIGIRPVSPRRTWQAGSS